MLEAHDRRLNRAIIAAAMAGMMAWPAAATAPLAAGAARSHPMSFEELLSERRTLVHARFSQDGSRLAYSEQGFGAASDGLLLNFNNFRTHLVAGGTARPLIVEGDQAGVYLQPCDPWRPDGAGVVLTVARAGAVHVAYADARTGAVKLLDRGPQMLCSFWAGRFLISIVDGAGRPHRLEGASILDHMKQRWATVWSGGPAQVTMHSSNPSFPNPEPKPGAVAVTDTETGESHRIVGDFHTITPAPDGRTFAMVRYMQPERDALESSVGRRGQVEVWRIGGAGPTLRHKVPFDAGYAALEWSPDGRRLLMAGRAGQGPELGLQTLDIDSGKVATRTLPQGVSIRNPAIDLKGALPIGWIAGNPAFVGEHAGKLRRDESSGLEYDAGRDVSRGVYAFRGDKAVLLTGFAKQSIEDFANHADGDGLVVSDGVLWMISPDRPPRRVEVKAFKVTGIAQKRGDLGMSRIYAVGSAAQADRIALEATDLAGKSHLLVISLTNGAVLSARPREAVSAMADQLDKVVVIENQGWSSQLRIDGPEPRAVATFNPEWRDRPAAEARSFRYVAGGETLTGWLLVPPNYKGGRLPTLLWVYGGDLWGARSPYESRVEAANIPTALGQAWAARGYAVIYPSLPIGRASSVDLADALAGAAVAAVDGAASAGIVDPERVAVVGHSFGGFTTASILAKRSDRFKAGIALSGVFDYAAGWGTRELVDNMDDQDGYSFARETLTMVEEGQGNLRAPPWEAPQTYWRSSPFYAAASIKTPLMLMVGDLDLSATSLQQSERMYAALRRTGNPAVMVRYWGQRHRFEDPGAARDQWARMNAWLDRYLGAPDRGH